MTLVFAGGQRKINAQLLGDMEQQLIRLLRQNYDRVPAEVLFQLMEQAGHTDSEETPCKVCKMVAQEEFKRIGT